MTIKFSEDEKEEIINDIVEGIHTKDAKRIYSRRLREKELEDILW
jgi:predicted site-specific integrase-resolvase